MARISILLAALLIVAACSSEQHASSGGPVPWLNRPLPHYTLPEPKVMRYPTTAAPCRASQLRVTRGRDGAATGNLLEEVVFRNTGTRPCLLRGYPNVTAETPEGRRVLHPGHGTFFGPLIPADLPPRGHVFLDFGTSDCMCHCARPGPARYRNLTFRLPHGGRVRTRVSIVVDCFLYISAFGLPERLVEPKARPGTPGTLKARIDAPGAVHAGTTLLYTVTLTNPTDVAVSLQPCPGYTDALGRAFALNCDSVHAIRPHGHVDYAMRIRLPPHDGVAKVAWSLNTPTGPYAVAVVRVEEG